MSAPDPIKRVTGALDRLRKRFDMLQHAGVKLAEEPHPVRQILWAVDIIEQGRDFSTDLFELVAAASVILYRGQEAP